MLIPASLTAKTQSEHMVLGQLYTNDIVDKRILRVMNDVPREQFVPIGLKGAAYVDGNLEVAPGRFLIEPLVFARLIDLATITPNCRVLVIGGLQGYASAVLAPLSQHITATEVDSAMIQQARAHLAMLNITNVALQQVSSLAEGYKTSAPYDVIVITGAVTMISDIIGAQLAANGRLVTVRNISKRPGKEGGLGKGLLVVRVGHHLQYREHFDASLPLLPGFEPDGGFTF